MKNLLILVTVALLACLASGQTIQLVLPLTGTLQSLGGAVTPAQGRNGLLYFTTSGYGYGTSMTDGTILRVSTTGKGGAIHVFDGGDGQLPGGMILASDGNLYGVAADGGAYNLGLFFKVTPDGDYTILYTFTGGSDGYDPYPAPIQASDGNLYGAAEAENFGATIYKYDLSTGELTGILSLASDGSQGSGIDSPLVQASDGTLYVTAESGGTYDCGTIIQMTTSGVVLQTYNFTCGSDGGSPTGLIQAADGNLYGTTARGGAKWLCPSCGTIFRLSGGVLTTIHAFTGYPDGTSPLASLVEGSDGNLYGTTWRGGAHKYGIVFSISPTGQYSILASFLFDQGYETAAALMQHSDGKFYGVAAYGGRDDSGTLYSFDAGLEPFIALVRYAGRIGQPVQILGQGLSGSTGVTINGFPSSTFQVLSDTYMTAVIPTGATTGPVVVTTPTGTLQSNHNLQIVQ
jgi:uncharacterized repeat protein (TIGR03803 family)